MGLNLAGTLALFQVMLKPHLLVPRMVINDIRQLDVHTLQKKGITGLVFDKDNCLTKPHSDELAQELRAAWPRIIQTFGRTNILIVSNSAGTRDDAGLLQAESVSRHLGVPVLLHSVKKPGCATAVYNYFSPSSPSEGIQEEGKGKGRAREMMPVVDVNTSTQKPALHHTHQKLLIVGDRVMTDVVLANRLQALFTQLSSSTSNQHPEDIQVIPVLTTNLWAKEGLGTSLMRWLENTASRRVTRRMRKRSGIDPLDGWKDCHILPASASAAAAPSLSPTEIGEQGITAPAAKPKTAIRQDLSRLGWLMISPITRRLANIQGTWYTFRKEATGIRWGFKYPEGLGRFRLLTHTLNGDPLARRS